MADKVIYNPILNRPYDEPCRHFAFDDEGNTDRSRTRGAPRSTSRPGTRCTAPAHDPFPPPKSGKIAIKVINHYGDEVHKVFEVESC